METIRHIQVPTMDKHDIYLHAVNSDWTICWGTSCDLPDHLAVVAPLVAEKPSKGFQLGFRWGLGHGLGVVILGLLGMFIKGYIDIESWSTNAEVLVGWLLIAVGLWSIWNNRSSGPKITAGHDHSDNRVVFGVGLFHGMAGTGHLLGVLPSLLLSQTEAGYLSRDVLYLRYRSDDGFWMAAVKSRFERGVPSNMDATDCNRLYRCRIVLDIGADEKYK